MYRLIESHTQLMNMAIEEEIILKHNEGSEQREAVLTKYWLYIQLNHENESEGLLPDSSFDMNQTRNEDSSGCTTHRN